jgi:hypothetical protein
MRNHFTELQRLLPPEATYLAAFTRVVADRFRDDRGEIGIIGAIILVVGFAAAAVILVAAIKGKLQSWINQIPT